MNAYSELYLENAMTNLGDMLDYAINGLGYSINEFWLAFVNSKVAKNFGTGDPAYIAGMSGVEVAEKVISEIYSTPYDYHRESYITNIGSIEYWVGWIMAYYQWYCGDSFNNINEKGLDIDSVIEAYILHESDNSKFVIWAEQRIQSHNSRNQLRRLRKYCQLSQSELSKKSGVSLRMIQLYEQGQNDIKKAQARQVLALAKALGTDVETLLL